MFQPLAPPSSRPARKIHWAIAAGKEIRKSLARELVIFVFELTMGFWLLFKGLR